MKIQSLIYTLTFLLISVCSFSQSYTFKVLANKGAEVKKSGEWTSLKTGALINDEDEVKLPENPYLGLIHSSGKTLVLKTAGTYKVADLASKVDNEGSSVASKYADFVLSKMSAEGKKNRLNATGAVDRAVAGGQEIKVFLPNMGNIYSKSPILQWSPVEGGEENVTYNIVFSNLFEEELMRVQTTDPQYTIDLNNPKLAKENVVLVQIISESGEKIESNTYAIKQLPQEEAQQVQSTVQELMQDGEEESALTKYILAGYYEENNLLVDALTNYVQAMNMAPEVESFREAYEEFLLRNRLK